MKLLRLSSTNNDFKTIEFKSGLNVIAGIQKSQSGKDTYNGVGKSFSLALIHYMFGSKLNYKNKSEKKIKDFLSSYGTFRLEFQVNGVNHYVEKNFKKNEFIINGNEIRQTNYPEELKKLVLGNKVPSSISFKNIFNCFARRYGGAYYNEAHLQQGQSEQDFQQRYINLWLLGIDTKLVLEKKKIKENLKRIATLKKEVKDLDKELERTNLKDLIDSLKKLKLEKSQFIIAENYDKFEKEADKKTDTINDLRLHRQRLIHQIKDKHKALSQAKSMNVDLDAVTRLYEEANFFFENHAKVRLEEAQKFHKNLLENRVSRFELEIDSIKQEITILDRDLQELEKQRDSILRDLSSTGALDEYNSINERIKSIEQDIGELNKYNELLGSLKEDENSLELKNAKNKVNALKYLNDNKLLQEEIEDKFRALVKKFYENQGGSFKINLTKDAKYLFDLDIHIPRDKSQGVNEVKIFCYDFLLYELNPDILGFIAHDGCIFSEMDPRQKSVIFKVALDYIKRNDLQYFINIGQSSLEQVLDRQSKINILTEEEKLEVKKGVRLELYDQDPSSWLFGRRFG